MDLTVERTFLVLIVLFSLVFGILQIFFRSASILGYSGEYWAGIFCVGIVLLIMGWAVVLSTRTTREKPTQNQEKVSPISYLSILLALIGLIPSGSVALLRFSEGNIILIPRSFEASPSYFLFYLLLFPVVLGFIALIPGVIAWRFSKKMGSRIGQQWAITGMLLGVISVISPTLILFLILLPM